ncbi:hypothetical protein KSS87_020247 [Heliosperma pusillum]|nr:hypothetical protein KSS87_020247 [Heliosperma pusillum]
MAKMHKMDGKVELNCSAEKIFEALGPKLAHVPQLCPDLVHGIALHQGGNSTYIIERTDEIDVKTMKITRSIIEGELLTYYKSLIIHFQPIPKGNGKSCVMVYTLEYEKIDENAPEPTEFDEKNMKITRSYYH